MNNEQFQSAIDIAFNQDCHKISEIDVPEYHPSEKFQNKMNKMLRKTHGVRHLTKGFAAVCISIIFVLGTTVGMTACAISPQLHSFIVGIFDNKQKISASSDIDAPEIIESHYLPTAIPDGYTTTEIPSMSMYSFMQSYSDGTNQIFFGQYAKSTYNNVDFAPSGSEYYTDENGQEYLVADFNGDWVVVWDNGDYILHIYSTLSREETLAICLSVKKVGK